MYVFTCICMHVYIHLYIDFNVHLWELRKLMCVFYITRNLILSNYDLISGFLELPLHLYLFFKLHQRQVCSLDFVLTVSHFSK